MQRAPRRPLGEHATDLAQDRDEAEVVLARIHDPAELARDRGEPARIDRRVAFRAGGRCSEGAGGGGEYAGGEYAGGGAP